MAADRHGQNVVDLADPQIAEHALMFGDFEQRAFMQHFSLLQHDQPVGQPQNHAPGLTGIQDRQAQFLQQTF